MKVLQINSVHYGSTGNIMRGIDALAKKQGIDSYISFPNGRHNHLKKEENHVYIGGRLSEDFHLLLDRITGLNGYFSILSTKRFLKQVDRIKPDIIHIHNLHNCYINLRMLFDYIKQNDIRTVWTLHDCWSMTGHCPHFMYPKCDRWRTGCYQCGRYKEYPKSFVDTSGFLYKKKREWFTEVKNMTVVTPSKWLADIVRSSYLKGYETRIIHNGTDLNVFRTVKGNFRKEYGLEDKKLILCVADDWNVKSKGLETVYGISTILPEDYRIILVGELSSIDRQDSDRVLYLGHTESREKLAEIYSEVDVLFNPTREEVFGLVNVEALACGTPVVVRKTGGCPEIVDESCGAVYDTEEIEVLMNLIRKTADRKPELSDMCIRRARLFNKEDMMQQYIDLYMEKVNG